MGQYCFARWRLSSVVACNAAGGRVSSRPPPGRARGRSGGRHCTTGQYGYVSVKATPRFYVEWGVESLHSQSTNSSAGVVGVRRGRATASVRRRSRQQQQLDVVRQLCPLSGGAERRRRPVTWRQPVLWRRRRHPLQQRTAGNAILATRNAWQSLACSPPGACKTQGLQDRSSPNFHQT